jgi:hypothetical protein
MGWPLLFPHLYTHANTQKKSHTHTEWAGRYYFPRNNHLQRHMHVHTNSHTHINAQVQIHTYTHQCTRAQEPSPSPCKAAASSTCWGGASRDPKGKHKAPRRLVCVLTNITDSSFEIFHRVQLTSLFLVLFLVVHFWSLS